MIRFVLPFNQGRAHLIRRMIRRSISGTEVLPLYLYFFGPLQYSRVPSYLFESYSNHIRKKMGKGEGLGWVSMVMVMAVVVAVVE